VPAPTNAKDPDSLASSAPEPQDAWEAFRLRHRLLLNSAIHSALFAVSLLIAYLIRFDAGVPGSGAAEKVPWFYQSFLPWLPYVLVAKLVIFGRTKLLRGGWQYASIRDVSSILLASWLFLVLTVVLMFLFGYIPGYFDRKVALVGDFVRSYSRGVLVLDFFATVFLVSTARLGFRIYREELRAPSPEGVRKVLVVGAGNAAEAVVREVLRMPVERYRVLGMVDDDPAKEGILIHGVPVLGTTQDIRRICKDLKIDEIIIAIPSATQKQVRRVIELCSGTQLKFQSLPSVGDLVEGRVTVSQIRPVDINDLLGRDVVQLDNEAIARFLRDRRVLVTGAGGSIGSEMCRQICKFAPACLVLVEQAETPLFDIENELAASHPQTPLHGIICDITDRPRVRQVWKEYRPEVVIHAAAHKHVPMMERNPGEAIKNNVLGTKNVADASCEVGCAEFVTISTDKAVNPSSIMGATKRVGEMYTQALNGQGGCRTQFKAVRFGNVLGSAGSVVPTFRRQIAAGGPVTVTHPDMTRYFMTIPEASQLVLQAAAIGQGGQIFLLDMGEPVKIVDLARQMITLSGFRPGEDIDIVFTGVRPGEKLFEELRTSGEDVEPTVHPKVLVWKTRSPNWEAVSKTMAEFEEIRDTQDAQRILQAIKKLVPEFKPFVT
jgi:FlaA1/EpsC-like NDP-sugar epimerase